MPPPQPKMASYPYRLVEMALVSYLSQSVCLHQFKYTRWTHLSLVALVQDKKTFRNEIEPEPIE